MEKKVYIVNSDCEFKTDVNAYSIDAREPDVVEEIKRVAEKEGEIYSLEGFVFHLNLDEISTFGQYWILID